MEQKSSCRKGFVPILVVLMLVVIVGLGFFILKSKVATVGQPTPQSHVSSQNISNQELLTYTNDTYGISLEYGKDLIVTYERKDGKTFVNGKVIDSQYWSPVDSPNPIVKIKDLAINSTDNDGSFGIEVFPKDSDNGQCSRWINKNKTQKQFNSTLFDYGEYYDAYNTFDRRACVVHGKYTYLLSIYNAHKENEARSGVVFNQILSTFKFNQQ